jgi:hypothetical protein
VNAADIRHRNFLVRRSVAVHPLTHQVIHSVARGSSVAAVVQGSGQDFSPA